MNLKKITTIAALSASTISILAFSFACQKNPDLQGLPEEEDPVPVVTIDSDIITPVEEEEPEEEDMIEIREKIVRKRNEKKDKLSKIRRVYKKAIERNIKKGYELKKYQTPRERAEDIQELMNEDIFELNSLYEKERYGQFND